MINKFIDPNAKAALNKMKMEIGNEWGIDNNMSGVEISSYENGEITEDLGGLRSKELVKMGEEALLREYYNKK